MNDAKVQIVCALPTETEFAYHSALITEKSKGYCYREVMYYQRKWLPHLSKSKYVKQPIKISIYWLEKNYETIDS